MFVKVENGAVARYPYTVGDLRRDNPRTSFPKTVPETTMAQFGMYPVSVEANPSFDPLTEKVQLSNLPVFEAGVWKISKTVVPLSAERIAANSDEKARKVRQERDNLLLKTDWVIVMHTEKGTSIPSDWLTYRQSLRDITNHNNFPYLDSSDWPVMP